MANVSGGRIEWKIDADDSAFQSQLNQASARAKSFGNDLDSISGGASNLGDRLEGTGQALQSVGQSMSNIGSSINKVALPAVVAIGGGLGFLSKMAFDQVNSVEQATLALRAYEKDGKKVDEVLNGLLKYARTDLGILFRREDLFGAAQGLKVMGARTEDLTGFVKIMSRSVGLGLSTWDDLTQVIGRVGSTGRLTGIDFDNLTKAGFKLDDSLRNTDITFQELFKHLDKGIPVDAMKGQANSIRGVMERLRTAFKDLGGAILGVDRDTGKFIKGGAGDQLMEFFKDLNDMLRKPEVRQAFKELGQSIASFVKNALPKIERFIIFLAENIEPITKGAIAFLFLGTSLKILGTATSAIGGVTVAIGTLINSFKVLSFLKLGKDVSKFTLSARILGKAMFGLKAAFGVLAGSTGLLVLAIAALIAAGVALFKNWDRLHPAVRGVAAAFLGPVGAIVALIKSFDKIKSAGQGVINFFNRIAASIPKAVQAIVGSISSLPGKIIVILAFLAGRAIRIWLQMNVAILRVVKGLVTGVINFFRSLPSRVVGFIQSLRSRAIGVFNTIRAQGPQIIQAMVNNIVSTVASLPGRAIAALGNFAGAIAAKLFEIAKGAWEAFKKGIFGSPKTKIEYALINMRKASIETLASLKRDVRSFNTLGSKMASAIPSQLQTSVTAPRTAVEGAGVGSKRFEYHIGEINISSDVDGEKWLKRLTRNQEITERGLTPPGGV